MTPESQSREKDAMDETLEKKYRSIQADTRAILASLGAISLMVLEAEATGRIASGWLRKKEDESVRRMGEHSLAGVAFALNSARLKVDTIMQGLGDFHNGNDGVSATMALVTKPVFEILRRRSEGDDLDD